MLTFITTATRLCSDLSICMVKTICRMLDLYGGHPTIHVLDALRLQTIDEDVEAVKIIRMFQPAMVIDNVPQKIEGDGA